MGTEGFSRGLISVSLILALVLSMTILMTFTSPPVLAGGVENEPGGTTIEVGQGQEFILRFKLYWDEPAWLGYFSLGIYWDSPKSGSSGTENENFTLVSASAYFEDNGDPISPLGTTWTQGVAPDNASNWRYSLVVDHTAGDGGDDNFYVDVVMRASGLGDVPHIAPDNHIIKISGTIDVAESSIKSYSPPDPNITIKVLAGGVDVSISPDYRSGLSGSVLDYTVTVINTGEYEDNYDLTKIDNAGWGPTVSPTLLTVPAGENRTATLSVTVPAAAGCTRDNITVTATGSAVENSASCIAHVEVVRAADVSISPDNQSGLPEVTLDYTVTVTNTGNVTDNYSLTANDDAGWSPTISPSSLVLTAGENDTATLSVIVPTDAIGCTNDNITVTATSTENVEASAENTCIAHATIVREVDVSISPTYGSAQPESDIIYTVTVANTGNDEDTYDLTPSDNAGWSLDVTPGSLTVPPFEDRTATLTVTVPSNTPYCTEDNIIVDVISIENENVRDNASCTGHAAVLRIVEVVISPVGNSALPGGTLSYTVTVTNAGNIWDNYSLAASDTGGWSPTVLPSTLALAMGQSNNATLSVTVPSVPPCTEDNVTVTATSLTDTVSDNDSCIAHRAKAEFSLITLYKVALDLDFYLHTGAMIVAKFYTYGGAYDNESIVWSGTTPAQLSISENIPHPENNPVENLTLYLTDDVGSVIETIDSYVVTRSDLIARISAIKSRWPFADAPERSALISEISAIKSKWPFAPS